MRVRKKPWARNEIATNERVVHNPESNQGNWKSYFNNNQPVHVEIGCGKGRFITQTAAQNQDINYIAIEREPIVIATGVRVSKALDCSLAFVVGDVKKLTEFFAPAEIERLYINFCDPWPNRKKWAKRRLTHANFLKMYETLLVDHGEIHFKTDNKELFEFSLNEFAKEGWRLKNITLDLHNSDFEGNIMTEYEQKFSEKGQPIYRCEAINEKRGRI